MLVAGTLIDGVVCMVRVYLRRGNCSLEHDYGAESNVSFSGLLGVFLLGVG
jgi:hypothetical protein